MKVQVTMNNLGGARYPCDNMHGGSMKSICLTVVMMAGLVLASVAPQDPAPAKTADKKAADKKTADKKRALPLKTTRKVEFTTDEATWLSLDVSPDGSAIVFEL